VYPRKHKGPETIFNFVLKWRNIQSDRNHPGGPLDQDEIFQYGKAIRELSRGLTRQRALAGSNYFSESDFLKAYLLYWFPVSYTQAGYVLDRLPGIVSDPPARALDLGSGPGPLALAMLDHGIAEVHAWDRSRASLSLARRLAEARGRHLTTRVQDLSAGFPSEGTRYNLISLGHVLNELWHDEPDRLERCVDLLERLRLMLTPGGRILLIEPALPATVRGALMLRDALVGQGWRVSGPCIFQGGCPALPDGSCHVEMEWNPPPALVRLAHAARLGRETLKFTWFIFEPDQELTTAGSGDIFPARVVSEPMRAKSGRVRYLLCGSYGRFALSAPDELSAHPQYRSLRRGDLIRVSAVEKRESGCGLTKESRIEKLEVVKPVKKPDQDNKPDHDRKPVRDIKPVRDKTPGRGRMPSGGEKPAWDEKPARGRKPAMDKTPVRGKKPAINKKPVRDEKQTRGRKPVRETMPSRDRKQARDGKPFRDNKPDRDAKSSRNPKPSRRSNPPRR
jgi:SAM-dependent methyltransferase